MGPRGLGPYVNIMDVLCIIKHYINIPVTVMVLLKWALLALGPTPFRLCRRALRVFFSGKTRPQKTHHAYLLQTWNIFVILFEA